MNRTQFRKLAWRQKLEVLKKGTTPSLRDLATDLSEEWHTCAVGQGIFEIVPGVEIENRIGWLSDYIIESYDYDENDIEAIHDVNLYQHGTEFMANVQHKNYEAAMENLEHIEDIIETNKEEIQAFF